MGRVNQCPWDEDTCAEATGNGQAKNRRNTNKHNNYDTCEMNERFSVCSLFNIQLTSVYFNLKLSLHLDNLAVFY
jgi:hypothetical protein